MKLLEVVRVPETSDDTFDAMMQWGKAMGKTCVSCQVIDFICFIFDFNFPLRDRCQQSLRFCKDFFLCSVQGHSRVHRQPPSSADHDGSRPPRGERGRQQQG